MAEKLVRGVSCPNCAGSLELIEGTVLMNCRYCDTSLLVKGDRGIARYYVPVAINREQVMKEVHKWFQGIDKARDLRTVAKFKDVFLVYVPFWHVTGTVIGWVLGDVKRGSGKNTRYEPVERRVCKKFEFTCPACDIGEFGVKHVDLKGDEILPFEVETVQKQGMTFEVLTTPGDVLALCDHKFLQWAEQSAGVTRKTFTHLKEIGRSYNLVYYPLWILRYEYKNRIYQITADAESGELLYGRAPGNNFYRVGALLGSMMLGNLIFTSYLRSGSRGDAEDWLGVLVLSIAIMIFGFWKFRYGGEVKKEQTVKDGSQSFSKLFPALSTANFQDLRSMLQEKLKQT